MLPVYCVHESYNPTLLPSRGTNLKVQPRIFERIYFEYMSLSFLVIIIYLFRLSLKQDRGNES